MELMHLRMGKERCMRRKLFFGTAVLVGAVFIMLNLFPEMAVPARAEADSIIK